MNLKLRSHFVSVLTLLLLGFGTANAQWMNLVPRTQTYAQPFMEACQGMYSWPSNMTATAWLGGFLGQLYQLSFVDEASVTSCFANMNSAGLQLTVEAGAFEPGNCGLGDECFAIVVPMLERLKSLGSPPIRYRMDEPLTKGTNGGWGFNDIVFQTCNFIHLMRTDPRTSDIQITDIEAYPANAASTLTSFMTAVNGECAQWGVQGPDTFELDHDTNEVGWSWSDVAAMHNYAHAIGWNFGYIFGSPKRPGWSWHDTAIYQGAWMQIYGIVPDTYTFESWEPYEPVWTIPEWISGESGVFMGTVYDFRAGGLFPW